MIILMGVAGAGKSLQGKMLAEQLGYRWVSTGEIFRSQLSMDRHQELLSGKLLDDKEVIEEVSKALYVLDNDKKVVLDGFPRTIAQAQWIIDQIKHKRFKLVAVFNIKASRKVVLARLLARGRADDNNDVIKERFTEYKTKTLPILDFFKDNNIKVIDINGEQSPEMVQDDMMRYISVRETDGYQTQETGRN